MRVLQDRQLLWALRSTGNRVDTLRGLGQSEAPRKRVGSVTGIRPFVTGALDRAGGGSISEPPCRPIRTYLFKRVNQRITSAAPKEALIEPAFIAH